MGSFTDLLYARSSFFEGVARLVDFGGTLNEYNECDTPAEADVVALRSDWEALAQDYRAALGSVVDESQASADHAPAATG